MKIWFLDTGSIVIDHAQLMWNIGGGTQGAAGVSSIGDTTLTKPS